MNKIPPPRAPSAPKPPPAEITPSLESLLTRDLQAWIAAKEAIERARLRTPPPASTIAALPPCEDPP